MTKNRNILKINILDLGKKKKRRHPPGGYYYGNPPKKPYWKQPPRVMNA